MYSKYIVVVVSQLFWNVQYNGRSSSWDLYALLWDILIAFICLIAAAVSQPSKYIIIIYKAFGYMHLI
jgi:hypothetical protein